MFLMVGVFPIYVNVSLICISYVHGWVGTSITCVHRWVVDLVCEYAIYVMCNIIYVHEYVTYAFCLCVFIKCFSYLHCFCVYPPPQVDLSARHAKWGGRVATKWNSKYAMVHL